MEIDREAVLQTFLAEAGEQLTTIEQGLLTLESRPDDQPLLEGLFRAAHTFKGNAFCLGLQELTTFAHSVEEALERLLDGEIKVGHGLVTVLLHSVDALRRMLPAALEGSQQPPAPEQQALTALLDRTSAPAPAAAPAPAPAAAPSPGSAPPLPAPPPERTSGSRTLRVGIDRLDRMLDLSGEISVARGRLLGLLEGRAGAEWEAVRDAQREADRLFLDLQEMVMKARLVGLGPTFRQHVRTVRDLALSRGKRARVVLEGEDVEVDTAIVDAIRDPLTHLVRNAVDHGLERPEVRLARGKDPVGCVTLSARHEAGRVVVRVADDGTGLDRERILAQARQQGRGASLERLSESEVFRLVLEPGFSTAEEVTEISGRGMGMDVVRRNVEALRGQVALQSAPGRGTEVVLSLPLTLAVIEGFAVGVGADTYVIPLESVVECVELKAAGAAHAEPDRGVMDLRGEPLPYLRLRRFLDLPGSDAARQSVVVVRGERGRAGIAVDALHGEGQTVIKPLGRLFQAVPGVRGSALLGSGRVALILDVERLLEAVQPDPQSAALAPAAASGPAPVEATAG